MSVSNKVEVSVVMSVHNGEKYLSEAVDSILNQSYEDFEFIIMDDFSSDNTEQLLNFYKRKDSRIKVIRNSENIGLTKSLNKAISLACGKYVVRMDADDIAIEDRIDTQVRYMSENEKVDIAYSDTFLIDKDSNLICRSWRPNTAEKVLDCLEVHNFIPHPSVIYRRESFIRIGGYDEACKTGQDLNLWLRMKQQSLNFGYIDEALIKYRLNPNSVRAYLPDYWFSVANNCIWNGAKFRCFKYFRFLTLRQKLLMVVKVMLPFSFFVRKFK